MGQLDSMDLPESGGHARAHASAEKASKSLWWLWVLIIAGIVAGVWYFRGSRTPSEAANPSAPATPCKGGRGGTGGSGMGVEEIFADIDANEDAAHEKTSESEHGATRADGVPVRAGECGVGPQ